MSNPGFLIRDAGRIPMGSTPGCAADPGATVMVETCDVCGARFDSVTQLIDHADAEHGFPGNEPTRAGAPAPALWLGCARCGASFRRPESLAAHAERLHPNGRSPSSDPP